MSFTERTVQVHRGDGIVANLASAVLVCLPTTPGQEVVADAIVACVERAAATSSTPGREIARQLAELLTATPQDDITPFAVVSPADAGLAVMLCGAVDLVVDQPDRHGVLSGRDAITWVDRVVNATFVRLEIRASGNAESVPDPRSRLLAGIVPGAGLTVLPPPGATPAAPGRLGILRCDDGSFLELDGNYVLGREPFGHADVTGGLARPFVFADTDVEVSRTHALVSVDGTEVRITDLGSSRGTFVAPPGATDWQPIATGEAVAIGPGYRLLLGQRTFVYEPPAA